VLAIRHLRYTEMVTPSLARRLRRRASQRLTKGCRRHYSSAMAMGRGARHDWCIALAVRACLAGPRVRGHVLRSPFAFVGNRWARRGSLGDTSSSLAAILPRRDTAGRPSSINERSLVREQGPIRAVTRIRGVERPNGITEWLATYGNSRHSPS